MDGQRGVVEVAFGFEAGLPHEVFKFGFAISGRLLAQVGEQADGFKVDVKDGVSVGQQANGVGGGALAEKDGESDSAEYDKNGESDPEVTATTSHG